MELQVFRIRQYNAIAEQRHLRRRHFDFHINVSLLPQFAPGGVLQAFVNPEPDAVRYTVVRFLKIDFGQIVLYLYVVS